MLEIKNMGYSEKLIDDVIYLDNELFLYLVECNFTKDSDEYISAKLNSKCKNDKFHTHLTNTIYKNIFKVIGLMDTSTDIMEGFLLYRENIDLYENIKNIYILSFYITEKYRNKGYGKGMIEFLKDEIKKYQKEVHINLTSLEHNINSHKFYESIGFVDTYPAMKYYEYYEEVTDKTDKTSDNFIKDAIMEYTIDYVNVCKIKN